MMSSEEQNPLIQWDDHPMSRFGWLNKWMLYLMCVPMTPKRTQRSASCIAMIKAIYIFFGLLWVFETLLNVYLFIAAIVHNTWNVDLLQQVLVWNLVTISGVISSVYFYFQFNYPWHNQLDVSCNTEYPAHCLNKHYKIVILSSIFVAPCVVIVIFVAFSEAFAGSFFDDFADLIWVLGLLCIFLRIIVVLAIHCVICIKYYHYLQNITKNMDKYELKQLSIEYQTIWNGYCLDYIWTLKWSIWLMASAWIIVVWAGLSLSGILWIMPLGAIQLIITIPLYVIPGYLLSEQYDELQRMLWAKFDLNIKEHNDMEKHMMLSSLIIYTTKYPIDMKFGPLKLTRSNTLAFLATLIVSRVVAYGVSLSLH